VLTDTRREGQQEQPQRLDVGLHGPIVPPPKFIREQRLRHGRVSGQHGPWRASYSSGRAWDTTGSCGTTSK
jgi:hypothetical protein